MLGFPSAQAHSSLLGGLSGMRPSVNLAALNSALSSSVSSESGV